MPEESSKEKKNGNVTGSQDQDAKKDNDATHVGPSAMTPDHMPRPWRPSNQKSPKAKKLVVAGVIAAVLVVLGAGGWLAYALWYQNPDKVVMDAIVNAIRSDTVTFEGAMSSKAGNQLASVTMNGKYGHKEGASGSAKIEFETGGTKMSVDADGVQMPDSVSYVRVKDVDKLYDLFDDALVDGSKVDANSSGYAILQQFLDTVVKPTAKKIDNKWIKFSVGDLKKVNAQLAEEYECTQNVLKKLRDNTGQLIELGSVYQDNKFLQVNKNLGNSGDYFRYEVGVVNEKLKDFANALTKTDVYKKMQACSPTSKNPLDIDVSSTNGSSNTKIEVWINQWSHELHKLNVETMVEEDGTKGTIKVALMTSFNKPIEVTAPKKDTITFDEAFSDISVYLNGLFQLGLSANQNRV